jgi:4-amino-4-deoxy-L-arabinose transferase-like glycosyltransferase
MFAKGEWIVPTVNGDLYTDKPILYFWLVLIASNAVGLVNEWTVRAPSALAGIGFVLATYLVGRDFLAARIGFIAAAVLATSVRVIWEARWAHVDMVFALFFVLTIYFAARSLLIKDSPNAIVLAYVFMALATLTKGLIGIALPVLLFGGFMIVRRDWQLIIDARMPFGIPLFLLVVVPWFYLVNSATDGSWLAEFIYVHHIQRYTAGSGHRQPFYYYFTTLPVDFLPWTIFAIPALFAYRWYRDIRAQPVSLFFLLWFLVVFLFFSISDTKRDLYLLPLLPPAALFVANYLNDLLTGRLPQGSFYRGMTLVFYCLVGISGLALPIAAWWLRREAFLFTVPTALTIAAAGIVIAGFAWQRKPAWVVTGTVLMMTIATLCASVWIFPYLEQFKSRRPFSLEVRSIVPPTTSLYIYADIMNDFNYYTGREVIPVLRSRAEVEELLRQSQDGYILIKDRDLKSLSPFAPGKIVATDAVGSTTWSLLQFKANDAS